MLLSTVSSVIYGLLVQLCAEYLHHQDIAASFLFVPVRDSQNIVGNISVILDQEYSKTFYLQTFTVLGPDQKTFTCFLLSKDQESSLNLASDGSSSSLLRDRTWKCWIQIFQLKFKWGGGSTKGMWIIWKHPPVRARWNMIFQVGSKKGNYFVKLKKIKEKKEPLIIYPPSIITYSLAERNLISTIW